MQPEGEFIQSLFRDKLPSSVSFYMFTGHRGNRNPFAANNDGTITLASLLDMRPQTEAKMNYTFNEDHASIISSPAVLAQYNTIINAFGQGAYENQVDGGYINLNFTYDHPVDGSRGRPLFVLRPVGNEAAATEVHLSTDDSGRRIGPFPAGDYTASIMASAVKPDKYYVPVTIEQNGTFELSFALSQDGMIYGHVAPALSADDRTAGMPAELSPPEDLDVAIQSVSLKGTGVERIIRPLDDQKQNGYDWFLSSTDFCTEKYFHFFGLPAGEYEVEITAKGYHPVIKKFVVKPGRPENTRTIELRPIQ